MAGLDDYKINSGEERGRIKEVYVCFLADDALAI